jgi:hypothetical protein
MGVGHAKAPKKTGVTNSNRFNKASALPDGVCLSRGYDEFVLGYQGPICRRRPTLQAHLRQVRYGLNTTYFDDVSITST